MYPTTRPPSSATPDQPNVVIIYADDLGYGDLGCFGSPDYRTPNLDRLASAGVRCTDWYSNSPVCSPSRAALLTGRHPNKTGILGILGGTRTTPGLAADQTTLADRLRRSGYRTGIFGKWHLGGAPEHRPHRHGFDEFVGILAGCVDYYSHISYWAHDIDPYHDLWRGDEEIWRNGEYLTDVIADEAASFITSCARVDQPFFCYVPFNAPHYPMHAPARQMAEFAHLPWEKQVMGAMIASMDEGVGTILAALDATGVRENTIVVFSADNGPSAETRNWLDGTTRPYNGGSAGDLRGHKGSLFDGGIREPFLISHPASLPAGTVVSTPAQMCDIVPTVLALAGLPAATDVDGLDVSTMLRGGPDPHERLYWCFGRQLAVREGSLKLVLDATEDMTATSSDPVHLADLTVDPGERHNLIHARPEEVDRLSDLGRRWRAQLPA